MKTVDEHAEAIIVYCPYCDKELVFIDHPFQYEVNPKTMKEVCYKCGKTFYFKPERN